MSSDQTHSERETRFDVHPLLRYDPEAMNGGIEVLKLEYFEAKTTKAPVPRNQDVPKEAFGIGRHARNQLYRCSHARNLSLCYDYIDQASSGLCVVSLE